MLGLHQIALNLVQASLIDVGQGVLLGVDDTGLQSAEQLAQATGVTLAPVAVQEAITPALLGVRSFTPAMSLTL